MTLPKPKKPPRSFAMPEIVRADCITIAYPPSVNHFWRMFRNRMIVSAEGRAFKASTAAILARQKFDMKRGKIRVNVDVYRPRRAGDLDNTLKVLLDSLTGVAYVDDSQIVEISAARHDDANNPRAEIVITEIEPIAQQQLPIVEDAFSENRDIFGKRIV